LLVISQLTSVSLSSLSVSLLSPSVSLNSEPKLRCHFVRRKEEETKDYKEGSLYLAHLATWFGALLIVEQPISIT